MSRPRANAGQMHLAEIFPRVQQQMLAQFAVGSLLRHAVTCGAATEKQWIDFLNRYLPRRYSASSAFVINADGHCSRQIDIAIYDNFYSPMLFPHESGLHIPAESVYAVFEVKQYIDSTFLRDAGEKAASVRMLRRTSVPVRSVTGISPGKPPHEILAGILAVRSPSTRRFTKSVTKAIREMPDDHRLDFGCALHHGAFEVLPEPNGGDFSLHFSAPIERLRTLGTAPAPDLMEYGRHLRSIESFS